MALCCVACIESQGHSRRNTALHADPAVLIYGAQWLLPLHLQQTIAYAASTTVCPFLQPFRLWLWQQQALTT